jgi:hypothetical protein
MGRTPGRVARLATLVMAATVCAPACGGSFTAPTSLSTPSFQFTSAPIVLGTGTSVGGSRGYSALGTMGLELYFSAGGPTVLSTDVLAPADGTVTAVTTTSSYFDDVFKRTVDVLRMDFRGANGYRFYLTGLDSATVPAGSVVTSGQVVGKVYIEFRQGARPIGLGLIDPTRTVSFARPERYGDDVLHGVFALDYFAEPARSAVMAKVSGPTENGVLSYDLAGTLQGLWFLNGSPIADSMQAANRTSWLFFVHAIGDPAGTMRAIYGHYTNGGSEMEFDLLGASDPAPSFVTPLSGIVKFQFPAGAGGHTLLLQMIDATTLRMETWDSYHSPGMTTFAFTAAARTYVR